MRTGSPSRNRRRSGSGGGPRIRDHALILRRFPYGETSLLVHLLTRRHGRVAVLAKGAYRLKSGYFGVLDLFDTLSVEWRANPRSELGLLTAGSLDVRRRGVTRDLARYRAALSVLELAGLGAREGHEEVELFDRVSAALTNLADPASDVVITGLSFELDFLSLQGLAPALDTCASCAARPPGESTASPDVLVPFSPERGGRLCPDCARVAATEGARIENQPLHALRVAHSLLQTPPRLLSRVRLDDRRAGRVRDLVRRFLEYHLESRPRTWGPQERAERRPRALPR
jgi:DNA repair protein RecO (recombination protein O)